MSILEKVRHHGVVGSAKKVITKFQQKSGYFYWKYRHAPIYANPTADELMQIESDLSALGVKVQDYTPPQEFTAFKQEQWFPLNYHGGTDTGVWDEKLLEHWIAAKRLGLMMYMPEDIYVDVAAAGSPWSKALRERKGISAYAIDLAISEEYSDLPYYRVENATKSSFEDASVSGVSLHCAYEMFAGEDDKQLIAELARILRPGGKAIILPLYMHTHYCAYATPDYFGKGYSDSEAKEYIRFDFYGIPSSRKYNAAKLKQRVFDPIDEQGLNCTLLALRNKHDFGNGIYCHFILEIEK